MSNTHDTQNDTDTSTDQRTTTTVIYDAIETLGGEREEAPVGMVVTRAVTTSPYQLPDVLDEINRLIVNGELYQPQDVTIRPTEPAVMADGGVRPAHDGGDLTRFQFEILFQLAEARDCADYGLGIKERLEAYYEEEVNHGRLYPNLDTLVENGLLTKSELDKRTNEYALTEAGKDLLWKRSRRHSEAVSATRETVGGLTDHGAAAMLEGVLTEVEPSLDEGELDDLGQVIDHLRSSGEDIPVVVEDGDA